MSSKFTTLRKSPAARMWSSTAMICLIASMLFAVLPAPSVQEKPDTEVFTIRLCSRTFTPQPGIDLEFRAESLRLLDRGRTTHAYVQLLRVPTASEEEALETRGLKLLSYIGGNSYTATILDLESIRPTRFKDSNIEG